MTADYTPSPEQQEAADEAVRQAVEAIALSYLAETADRRLTVQQRRMQDRAAALARGLVSWEQRRKVGHP